MDFLLVLIELFSLGVTAEALRANGAKFQVEGVTPTNHSFYQKTRLNDLSYGIKIWTDLSSALSKCTCSSDGQTDAFLLTRPPCIQYSAVKNYKINTDKNEALSHKIYIKNIKSFSRNCIFYWECFSLTMCTMSYVRITIAYVYKKLEQYGFDSRIGQHYSSSLTEQLPEVLQQFKETGCCTVVALN